MSEYSEVNGIGWVQRGERYNKGTVRRTVQDGYSEVNGTGWVQQDERYGMGTVR